MQHPPIAIVEEDEVLEPEILSTETSKSKDELVPRGYNQKKMRIATILTPQFAKKTTSSIQQDVLSAKGIPAAYHFPKEKKSHPASLKREITQSKVKAYHLAIAKFNKMLMKDISDYKAYNGRGIALYGLGETKAAIEDFNRAIAISPSFAKAFYNRGRSNYKRGKIAEAIDDFSLAIQYQPQQTNAYKWRAKCYRQLNYVNASVIDYQRCMQVSPKLCKQN